MAWQAAGHPCSTEEYEGPGAELFHGICDVNAGGETHWVLPTHSGQPIHVPGAALRGLLLTGGDCQGTS